jgi:cell division protein ZapE
MISFHDFIYQNKNNKKENIIDKFVNKLKRKYKLIYFDEFQVTNIVDAMILGNLFKKIFDENLKVIFSSNIKINDLYKDGLQRDQFIPFIKIMKKRCFEQTLVIKEDYRKSQSTNNERYLYPLNESTNFKINKIFRKLTKGKHKKEKILLIKGRKFTIKNYYEGIVRFDFNDLCNKNIGAEDYVKISEVCKYILIENLPNFDDNNSNQQQRFITLIDIIYEKKVKLIISSVSNLNKLTSGNSLSKPFKRTLSRLHELTSNSNP